MDDGNVLAIPRALLDIYYKKRVSRSAAALSYYTILTLFPLLICMNAMLSSVFPTTERFLDFAEGLLPEETISVLADYLRYVKRDEGGPILTAGLLLMCTTSAAVFRALHNIMADLHGKPRFRALHSWPLSFVFSLLFLLVMYFAVLVVLLGERLLGALAMHISVLNPDSLWNVLRFPILFFTVLGMLWGLYRITAPDGARKGLLIGALAATTGVEVLSALFSMFIGMSAKYALVYGSLASLIILILWLYLCCTIVIMGNALNVVLNRR